MGRFTEHASSAVLRVGYVSGRIAGVPQEMDEVVKNIRWRWHEQGYQVVPGRTHTTELSGRPAVVGEHRLVPHEGSGNEPLALVYAYVHHGLLPGIMIQLIAPLDHMDTMRPVLVASLQTLHVAEQDGASMAGALSVLPFPLLLVSTLLVGAFLLHQARRPPAFG
jgi:hypothetical protein